MMINRCSWIIEKYKQKFFKNGQMLSLKFFGTLVYYYRDFIHDQHYGLLFRYFNFSREIIKHYYCDKFNLHVAALMQILNW